MGDAFQRVFLLLVLMGGVSLLEAWRPFRERGTRSAAPNLGLTLLFLAVNLAATALLAGAVAWLDRGQPGLLAQLQWPAWAAVAAGIVLLDFSAWAAHLLMHKVPWLWRFHRVHHSDVLVDVTTAFRQHPGETVLRFTFTAAPALLLGVPAEVVLLYRALSGISALIEHANVRLPDALDRALRAIIVSPLLHKVHHSRTAAETDSNYGNILSVFDRLLGTFTPASRATAVRYGLDGFDAPAQQRIGGLLRLPWRA